MVAQHFVAQRNSQEDHCKNSEAKENNGPELLQKTCKFLLLFFVCCSKVF
jgi:hypothetical protein